MPTEKTKLPSAFSLFNPSWEAVQRSLPVFGILYLLPLVTALSGAFNRPQGSGKQATIVSDGLFGGWSPLAIGTVVGTGLIVLLIGLVIGIIIQAMLQVAEFEAAEGKKLEFGQVWQRSKPLILRLFGLSLLTGLIIVGGFILLIVPGLIFLRRYFLAPYFLIDKNLSITGALKESAKASKPYAGAIWGLIGVGILLSLTSIIPVVGGLVSFVLGAAYSVAPALRYGEIKKAGY